MREEKRKYERSDLFNLVSFACLDEKGDTVQQGMGRTLNISEAGILLEIHVDVEPEQMFFITIGFDDDTLELKGKVAYCDKSKEKKIAVGIHFLETGKADILILKQYIKLFENK